MKFTDCCYNCTRRYYDANTKKTCHSTCPLYKQAKAEREKILEEINKENILRGYAAECSERLGRRYKFKP